MPAYDTILFDPPAPLTRVTLRNPASGAVWVDVPMLLDSGADISLVPGAAVERLGASQSRDRLYELAGFDGSISLGAPVELELIWLGRAYRGQYLLVDREWGILGRNILNTLTLVLAGPRLTWDVSLG